METNINNKRKVVENSNNVPKNTLNQKSSNIAGYVAICLSLVIAVVYLICFISSGGSISEADGGSVWWLAVLYCWALERPITLASIVMGILGLKGKNKIPSYISFVINIIKIVFFSSIYLL